jgi:hypothetical protein
MSPDDPHAEEADRRPEVLDPDRDLDDDMNELADIDEPGSSAQKSHVGLTSPDADSPDDLDDREDEDDHDVDDPTDESVPMKGGVLQPLHPGDAD